jgi:hypothetical protein
VLFDEMIKAGDMTISRDFEFLRSLGELRNILSHVSCGPRHIAELSQEALDKFQAIVHRTGRPPMIRDVASKPVKGFRRE